MQHKHLNVKIISIVYDNLRSCNFLLGSCELSDIQIFLGILKLNMLHKLYSKCNGIFSDANFNPVLNCTVS